MVEVRLRAVRVDLQSNTPVLLLQESEGLGRTLPIFIGAPEATAIAFALQGMDTPRPMTHDLIRDLLDALAADVIRVVITELKTATYFAEIVLRHGEREIPVSSRPSDAVAVAVRTGAPLFVADDLMDTEGIMLAVDEEDDERIPTRTGPTPRSWWASSGTSSTPSAPRTSLPERRGSPVDVRSTGRALPVHPGPIGLRWSPPPAEDWEGRNESAPEGLGGWRVAVRGGAGRLFVRVVVPDDHLVPHDDEPIVGDHLLELAAGLDHPRRRLLARSVRDLRPRREHRREQRRRRHHRDHLALKNITTGSCTLGGYPGLLLVGLTGADLPTNVVRKGTYSFTAMAPTTVTWYPAIGLLQHRLLGCPGGRRDVLPDVGGARGHPPNRYDHLTITATLAPCGGGTMVVSPVFLSAGSDSPDHGAVARSADHRRPRRGHQHPPPVPSGQDALQGRPQLVEAQLGVDHVVEQSGG